MSTAERDFAQLQELDRQIKSFGVGQNPYTWFTIEALEDTWRNLQKIIKERDAELAKEFRSKSCQYVHQITYSRTTRQRQASSRIRSPSKRIPSMAY